jgi:hypothetical protein
MTDSLKAAAALADRLGGSLDSVLPEAEPVIDSGALAAHRMELRQVAGISAGGSMELRPGRWDFGPVRTGPGRLQDGEPDSIGFTLVVGSDLGATIGPGEHPVRLDDQPVMAPAKVGGRMINAGSARFVIARPRPPRKRDGGGGDPPASQLDPWVLEPVPRPGPLGPRMADLLHQRRRLHYGPDEIRHRVEGGGPLLWNRGPDHPLFGTAVIGMADVSVRGNGIEVAAAAPVSIDAVGSSTVLVGRRSYQLAVARHLILGLAATIDPRDLRLGLHSELPELAFVRNLPHATEVRSGIGGPRRRNLLVVDRAAGGDRWPILPGGGTMLILGRRHDPVPEGADVVTVVDEAFLSVQCGDGERVIQGVTPTGFAAMLAQELADRLTSIAT